MRVNYILNYRQYHLGQSTIEHNEECFAIYSGTLINEINTEAWRLPEVVDISITVRQHYEAKSLLRG